MRSSQAILAGAVMAAANVAGPGPAAAQVAPVEGIRNADPRAHAIVGADIVTAPGHTLRGATIVIRDGVIEAVGEVAPPPEARVWSATGLTVYPGLIEAALLIDVPAPEPGSSGGAHWNRLVHPQVQAAGAPLPPAALRESLRAMGFAAAAVYPASGILRGSGAVIALAAADEQVLLYRDRAAMAAGFDRTGWGAGGYPGSLMGSIALLRQTFLDAAWHEECRRLWRADSAGLEPPAHEEALEALRDVMAGAQEVLFDAPGEHEALRAARIAEEFELRVAILGGGLEFRRLREIVAAGRPLIVPLAYPQRPDVSTLAEARNVSLRELQTWEQAPTNPRRLVQSGATVALTTHRLEKRSDFPARLAEAIRHGLDETAALAALTTVPARLLGLDAVLGTIEPGKAANLVLVEGSLFEKSPKVRETWINGRRHEITPRPPATFEGQGVLVAGSGDSALEARVELDTKARRFAVHGQEGAKTGARRVTVTHDRVAAVLEGKALGAEGYVRLEGVVTGGRVIGTLALPDGTELAMVITPREPEPEQPVLARDAAPPGAPEERAADDPPAAEAAVEPAPAGEPGAAAAPGEPPAGEADAVTESAPQVEPAGSTTPRPRGGRGEGRDGGADEGPPDKFEPPPEALAVPLGAYGLDEPPAPQAVAVVGATIWTCGPAGVIENGALLIDRGKIAWVGEAGGFTAPAGAKVIDGAGRHVTPGLIDCHSHTGISGGVNEGTQAVTAEVRIGDVVDPDDVNWYRELAGGLTAANQLHGSANPIGGQNSVVKIRWGGGAGDFVVDDAPGGIKFALGENVKRSTGRYPNSRMGVETAIRDAFTAAREYRARRERYEGLSEEERRRTMPPRRDLELEALAEVLDGSRLVHCHSYRQDEILMLIRLADEMGFTVGTFQHVLEGYKVADAIADHGAGASTFSDWWAYKVEVMDAIPFNGALMHEVGVLVSFNSDSSELARRMNAEAAKAVRYGGVEAHEALKFVTINPAKQLRIDHRTGSLEAGKDGDFALWSASPLSVYAVCEQTWIEGACHFDLESDRALRARDRAERTRLLQKVLAQAHGRSGGRGGTGGEGDGEPAAPDREPVPAGPGGDGPWDNDDPWGATPSGDGHTGDDPHAEEPYSCCREDER